MKISLIARQVEVKKIPSQVKPVMLIGTGKFRKPPKKKLKPK